MKSIMSVLGSAALILSAVAQAESHAGGPAQAPELKSPSGRYLQDPPSAPKKPRLAGLESAVVVSGALADQVWKNLSAPISEIGEKVYDSANRGLHIDCMAKPKSCTVIVDSGSKDFEPVAEGANPDIRFMSADASKALYSKAMSGVQERFLSTDPGISTYEKVLVSGQGLKIQCFHEVRGLIFRSSRYWCSVDSSR